MNRNTRRLCASATPLGILLAGLSAERPADAAWDFVPDISFYTLTENNPRFTPEDTVPVPGSLTSGSATSGLLDITLDLANYSERGFIRFEPNIMSYHYTGGENSDLDSNDLLFNGGGEYRWRTVAVGFAADFRKERLSNAEFATVDIDNDPNTIDPDTGETGRVVFIDQDRTYYNVRPYLSFDLSPRNTLKFDVTKYDVSYSGSDLAFRTGFNTTRVSTGIYRNVDKENQVSAVMYFDSFEADVNRNTYDTVTIEGAFSHPISPTWDFNMAAGVLRSDYKVFNAQQQQTASATTDFTMRVGFRKRAERTSLNFDLTRNVWPSSSGFAVVRRDVSLFVDHDFSQRFNMNFGFRLQDTDSLNSLNTASDRTYEVAEMNFEWALKPVLFLLAGWDYRTQEFTNDILNGGSTDATTFNVGIRYRGLSKRNPTRR